MKMYIVFWANDPNSGYKYDRTFGTNTNSWYVGGIYQPENPDRFGKLIAVLPYSEELLSKVVLIDGFGFSKTSDYIKFEVIGFDSLEEQGTIFQVIDGELKPKEWNMECVPSIAIKMLYSRFIKQYYGGFYVPSNTRYGRLADVIKHFKESKLEDMKVYGIKMFNGLRLSLLRQFCHYNENAEYNNSSMLNWQIR